MAPEEKSQIHPKHHQVPIQKVLISTKPSKRLSSINNIDKGILMRIGGINVHVVDVVFN